MTLQHLVSLLLLGTLLLPDAGSAQSVGTTFEDIPWETGPGIGSLGSEAQVGVPAGCLFTGRNGTRQFMELLENPVDGHERGVLFCEGSRYSDDDPWFVVFSYADDGYVRDHEADKLDAAAILKSIRRGTEKANEERRRRGWGTLTIEDWITRPHYDVGSNNLTWAVMAVDEDGNRVANHSVRLLGRGGVMKVNLVTSPSQLSTVMPTFSSTLNDFQYLPGQRYAEWRPGDKVATYGLTALVAGGAGAAAAKTGLLAKFWKFIAGAVAAAAAGLRSAWARITSRS